MNSPYSSGSEPPVVRIRLHLLAITFAALGGVLGILGALVAEVRSTAPFVAVFLAAPIIEEITKPVGIYLFLIRWRDVLRSQLYIALLVALSGLCFGLLESLVYVTVYAPDHSRAFFIYRFTVTVLMHTGASFIAGFGINARLIDWANGERPFPRPARIAFLSAMGLHAAYNATAVALYFAGPLNFE